MANIKANAKSAIKAKKLREIHKAEKSVLRNRIKLAKQTGNSQDLNAAIKVIDSKAAKGVIKKQTADRLKSRLTLHVNKLNSPQVSE